MAELTRRAKVGGLVGVTLLAGAIAWRTLVPGEASMEARDRATGDSVAAAQSEPNTPRLQDASEEDTPLARAPEDPFPNPPPELPPALLSELFPQDDPAWGWAQVDLDALREEMPNNAAFDLAVPTDDHQILAERQSTRDRWKREYGEILQGAASESEIREYYAERQKISRDYVEFTDVVIERYGDVLNPQDLGLLQLAQTLHRARLEEMPSRLTDSIARHEKHAELREAWLADEAAFQRGSEGERDLRGEP